MSDAMTNLDTRIEEIKKEIKNGALHFRSEGRVFSHKIDGETADRVLKILLGAIKRSCDASVEAMKRYVEETDEELTHPFDPDTQIRVDLHIGIGSQSNKCPNCYAPFNLQHRLEAIKSRSSLEAIKIDLKNLIFNVRCAVFIE